jgi:hypothetical protein
MAEVRARLSSPYYMKAALKDKSITELELDYTLLLEKIQIRRYN